MTAAIVAAVFAAGLLAQTAAFLRVVRAERREHKNERELLLNQVLHLSGKTWTPPPADGKPEPEPWEPTPPRFTAHPERYASEE